MKFKISTVCASVFGFLYMVLIAFSLGNPGLAHAAACSSISQALSAGSSGAEVSALQQFLAEQKLLSSDSVTGYYGALTTAAVEQFQAAHAIVSSGTPDTTGFGAVGPKTKAAIAGLCPGVSLPAETSSASAVPSVMFERSLSLGISGLDVSALQQLLREKGFFTYPQTTGYYGALTAQAVAAFQQANGLEPVGTVGPMTRNLLNQTAAANGSALGETTQATEVVRRSGGRPSSRNNSDDDDDEAAVDPGDVTAPLVSNVASSTTYDQVTLTWSTDEPSTSQIEYGTTSAYAYAASTTLDASLITNHSVTIGAIADGTAFHFRILSSDASGNVGSSTDSVFATLAYDADARALMARMSPAPNSQRKIDMNTLVTSLKTAGVWSKLDVLYLLAAHTEQAALLNWKGDTRNLSKNGTVTLDPEDGFRSDGSTGYLSGIGMPTTMEHFTQNNAHLGLFVTHAGNGNGDLGRSTTLGETLLLAAATTSGNPLLTGRVNNVVNSTWPVVDSSGHSLLVRSTSTQLTAYKNGASLGATSSPSAAVQASDIMIGRYSTSFSTDMIGAVSMGGALTGPEAAALNFALRTYLLAVGWQDVATSSLALGSGVNLPDGQGGVVGEGFTVTGLAHDPIDGTWWAGNDGRGAPGDTTFEPSIVHLSADFTTKVGEYVLSSIGVASTTKMSVQGVAYDTSNNSIWFVGKDTNNVPSNATKVINISKAGSILGSFAAASSTNGLAYDSQRNQLVTSDNTTLTWRNKGTFAAQNSLNAYSPDQLFYDAQNDYLLYSTGANGENGKVYSLDVDLGYPVRIVTLVGADAVEGISLVGTTLYETNDAFFHSGTPPKNRALIYPNY